MSSDIDNKKSTLKDGEEEKSEIVDKSTDSSKDADDIKTDNDVEVKNKTKIITEIVDENDPLKEDFEEKDEKDPLSNSEDETVESAEDAGSGDEKAESDDEKNSINSEDEKNSTKEGGSGTRLGDIPQIDACISRFKLEDLKILHNLLYNEPGKATLIKKNLKKFNGFDFAKGSNAYQKKLAAAEKLEIKQLKTVCEILELDKKGSKDEIASRICEFLLEPRNNEIKKSNSGSTGGRPKRSAAVKAKNRGFSSPEEYSEEEQRTSRRPQRARKGKRTNLKDESSSNDSDDDKGSVYSANDDISSEDDMPRSARNRGKKPIKTSGRLSGKRSASSRKQTSVSDDDDDDDDEVDESAEDGESDFSDEPKSKRGRGANNKSINNKSKTPKKATKPPATSSVNKNSAKKTETPPSNPSSGRGRGRRAAASAAASKIRDQSSDEDRGKEKSSSEDEPLVKKSKTPQPPTDDEIKMYVKEILDGANLEEITMKTVCKQVYAHYPDFDLAHKKDFIKTTVKSLIST